MVDNSTIARYYIIFIEKPLFNNSGFSMNMNTIKSNKKNPKHFYLITYVRYGYINTYISFDLTNHRAVLHRGRQKGMLTHNSLSAHTLYASFVFIHYFIHAILLL